MSEFQQVLLHSRCRVDGGICPSKGNTMNVEWAAPENGKPPQGSIGVSLNGIEPLIVQRKAENGYWITTTLTPGSLKILTEDVLFLVPKRDGLRWADFTFTRNRSGDWIDKLGLDWICYKTGDRLLPATKIRCPKSGTYGNIYIGRMNGRFGREIGMVVNYRNEWTFYTSDIEQGIKHGFEILCRQTNSSN